MNKTASRKLLIMALVCVFIFSLLLCCQKLFNSRLVLRVGGKKIVETGESGLIKIMLRGGKETVGLTFSEPDVETYDNDRGQVGELCGIFFREHLFPPKNGIERKISWIKGAGKIENEISYMFAIISYDRTLFSFKYENADPDTLVACNKFDLGDNKEKILFFWKSNCKPTERILNPHD